MQPAKTTPVQWTGAGGNETDIRKTVAGHFSNGLLQQARSLHTSGRLAEAEALYQRLLTQDPGHTEAWHLLGVIALQKGQTDDAVKLISRALSLDANNAQAHANLGSALLTRQQLDEALAHYDHALRINPRFMGVHHNRGNALQLAGRHDEAAAAFGKLLESMPNADFVPGNLQHARGHGCDWSDFDSQQRSLIDRVRAGKRVARPFAFLSVSASAADQLQCARTYAASVTSSSGAALWKGERYEHDRIRVAYLSADFRDHIVTRLMTPVYENHDTGQFQIVGVSLAGSDDSPAVERARRALGEVIDLARMSDAEAAGRLRQLEIDIVVDLTGYTQGGRAGILALRPAPAQVSYLGFPGTMGASHIDYILADEFVIPPESRRYYAEQVAYLPECYHARDERRPPEDRAGITRREEGLPDDALVYCCFNNSYKLNPSMFDIWARLLNANPGSLLWLVAGSSALHDRLRREAERRGVDPERLCFAARLPYDNHIARLALADVFLDTLPFNGGATVSDALYAGVPVLTCAGEAFAARMAGSLLRNAGLQELVTNSLEEYEQLALALSADPQRLARLRARLAAPSNGAAPLFDARRFCRHLETAYRRIWEISRRSDAPASFTVEQPAGDVSQAAL